MTSTENEEPKGSEPSSKADAPVQIHKWRRCTGCGHPQHSKQCRELVSPDPFANVDECGCLALTSMEKLAAICRDAGGCSEHNEHPKPWAELSSDECTRSSRGHCFEHGSKCCYCGFVNPMALQLLGAQVVPRPEEPEPSSGECDHSTYGWKPRYYGPDGRCLHPNRRGAGALHDGPGGRKTWLYRCPDCKELFRELEPPEDAPCEHGGGDVQDCPHGCAETTGPDCHRRHAVAIEGECPCSPSCGCCKAEPVELPPLKVFEPPPQPARRPPYAVAYAVQGHLYEVALPGDATVEAVDGALVIRHSLGQVAGIVAVNPMSEKKES